MKKPRGLLVSLCLSASMGLMAGEARAGSIHEVLKWNWAGHGVQTLDITGSPFGTVSSSASGTSLTLNTTPLNTFLKNHGSALQFAAGSGASSNQSVITQGETANLTSNGNLSVISGSAGSTQMTILVYQQDWSAPTGVHGVLQNSGSATFTLTASGDTEKYNSWFDPTNSSSQPTGMAAGLQTYTASYAAGQNVSSPIGSPVDHTSIGVATVGPNLYALANQTVVTLSQKNTKGENGQYQVTTTLFATVPEPASIALILAGMPLTIVGMLRRGRHATVAG